MIILKFYLFINRIPHKFFGQLLISLFSNFKFRYLLIVFGMNSFVPNFSQYFNSEISYLLIIFDMGS
jgi:hypothetical protein